MPKLHKFPTEGNRTEINKESLEWYRADRVYFTSFEGIPDRMKKTRKFFTLLTFKDDNYDLERYRQSNIHKASELLRRHSRAVRETGFFLWEPDKGNYPHLAKAVPIERSLSCQIASQLRVTYGPKVFGNSRPERAIEKTLLKYDIRPKPAFKQPTTLSPTSPKQSKNEKVQIHSH